MKYEFKKGLHLVVIRLMQSKDVLIFIRGEVPRIVSDRYRKWSDPRRMMTSLVLCKHLCFKNNHNAKNISQKMSERSCPHALVTGDRGRERGEVIRGNGGERTCLYSGL